MAVMGLTSWFADVFRKNKLTMFAGPLPLNSLDHLAESKVNASNIITFAVYGNNAIFVKKTFDFMKIQKIDTRECTIYRYFF